jgi:hypothetical protein
LGNAAGEVASLCGQLKCNIMVDLQYVPVAGYGQGCQHIVLLVPPLNYQLRPLLMQLSIFMTRNSECFALGKLLVNSLSLSDGIHTKSLTAQSILIRLRRSG